jgi:ferritin-like metal-binding protein YciE
MTMQARQSNLINQLQDAWAFESRLYQLLGDQSRACCDPASLLYRGHVISCEHLALTEIQIQRLERRLESLNHSPSGEGGWFTARLHRLAREAAATEVSRNASTQLLITSYGIKQVECAMYRTLLDLAQSTDDEATESLAQASLSEEEATARRLLFCIGTASRNQAA